MTKSGVSRTTNVRSSSSSAMIALALVLSTLSRSTTHGFVPRTTTKTTSTSTTSLSVSWDDLKEAAYGTVDVLSGRAFAKDRDERRATSSTPTTNKKKRLSGGVIADGYGDAVESLASESDKSKSAVLVRQYEAMKRESRRRDESVLPESVGGDGFASAKESFYSTADLLFKKADGKNTINTMSPSNPSAVVEREEAVRLRELQSAIREYDEEAAKDEENNMPAFLTRLRKRSKLRKLEGKAEANKKKEERVQNFERTKTTAYDVADAAVNTVKTLSELPKTVADTSSKVKRAAVSAYDTVVAIPDRTKAAADAASKSVDEAKEIAKVVAEDVRNVPSVAAGRIRKTKEDASDALRKIQEFPDEVRYAVGIKKRPVPPPPPKTNGEIAKEVAADAAAGIAKVAWGATKFSAGLGVKGVKTAWRVATTERPKEETTPNVLPKSDAPDDAKTTTTTTKIVTTVADVDEDLGREVTDALRLVDEALAGDETKKKEDVVPPPVSEAKKDDKPKMSFGLPSFNLSLFKTKEKTKTPVDRQEKDDGKVLDAATEDLNEALARAKAAATQAKRDSEEIRNMVEKVDPSSLPFFFDETEETSTRFKVVAAEREAEQLVKKEKEEAERKKEEEEKRRKLAEQKARKEAEAAAQKARKEEEDRKLAEQKAKQEEEKKLVEQKAKQEEEERKLAEQKAKQEEEERKLAEQQAKKEEEDRKLAEQKAKKEEDRKLAEQQAKKEEEDRKLAEQKAKKEEDRKLAEQKAKQEEEKARLKKEEEDRKLAEQKAKKEEEEKRKSAEQKAKRQREEEAERERQGRKRNKQNATLEWEARREKEREEKRSAEQSIRLEEQTKRKKEEEERRLAEIKAEKERERERKKKEDKKKLEALQNSLLETALRKKKEERARKDAQADVARTDANLVVEEPPKRKGFFRVFNLFRRSRNNKKDDDLDSATADLDEALERAKAAAAQAKRDAEEIVKMIEKKKRGNE